MQGPRISLTQNHILAIYFIVFSSLKKKKKKIGHSHNKRDSIFKNYFEHNFSKNHQNSLKIIKKTAVLVKKEGIFDQKVKIQNRKSHNNVTK